MKLQASDQITLVASTLAHVRTELVAPDQLATLLGATVPTGWPTGEYDRDAMEFFRERLEQGGKEAEGWYSWYAIRNADEQSTGVLVGAAGYFGPPDASGTVEIGYSVLPEWQRRGYARAMIQALVKNAFAFDDVERVIAHTAGENHASIAVLLRCGFGAVGQGHEPGMLRFERKHGASAVKRGKEGYDD